MTISHVPAYPLHGGHVPFVNAGNVKEYFLGNGLMTLQPLESCRQEMGFAITKTPIEKRGEAIMPLHG